MIDRDSLNMTPCIVFFRKKLSVSLQHWKLGPVVHTQRKADGSEGIDALHGCAN